MLVFYGRAKTRLFGFTVTLSLFFQTVDEVWSGMRNYLQLQIREKSKFSL